MLHISLRLFVVCLECVSGCNSGLHVRITHLIHIIHCCPFTVSSGTYRVTGHIGHNVTLTCRYDARAQGVLSFCWGKGTVPTSKCSNTILSYDGAALSTESPRYQLLGPLTDGDVSLTILDAQREDAGVYGCRVEIPGWFNDQKVNTELIMEEGIPHGEKKNLC